MAVKIDWRTYQYRPYDRRMDFHMYKAEAGIMRTLAQKHFNMTISSALRLMIGFRYIEDANYHLGQVIKALEFKA